MTGAAAGAGSQQPTPYWAQACWRAARFCAGVMLWYRAISDCCCAGLSEFHISWALLRVGFGRGAGFEAGLAVRVDLAVVRVAAGDWPIRALGAGSLGETLVAPVGATVPGFDGVATRAGDDVAGLDAVEPTGDVPEDVPEDAGDGPGWGPEFAEQAPISTEAVTSPIAVLHRFDTGALLAGRRTGSARHGNGRGDYDIVQRLSCRDVALRGKLTHTTRPLRRKGRAYVRYEVHAVTPRS